MYFGTLVDQADNVQLYKYVVLKMYDKNKSKYVKKKNVYYRPWGRYTNLFEGKEFLIKELFVKPKGILSLQKHHH